VISTLDWASVIVAVGEYDKEWARGDPRCDGRCDAGRELREPREPREREPDRWEADFSSKYSSSFFFFPLRVKEGKQNGGGGGGGGGDMVARWRDGEDRDRGQRKERRKKYALPFIFSSATCNSLFGK